MSAIGHTKFKVGDKVRVVKKVEQENGWGNKWVHGMDKLIGEIFTIEMIDEYGIGFKGLHYGFPPSSLELVTEEPQSVNQKRHKHADVIHAWAEGDDIEIKNEDGKWVLQIYPLFYPRDEYRIKPKEPEWWDNIPKHGILVKGINSGQVVALYNKSMADVMWEPLTNEEIEAFKR